MNEKCDLQTDIISLEHVKGNLHSFIAGKEGCVFLDLFVPPYDPPARDCNYYKILYTEGEKVKEESKKFLHQFKNPQNIEIVDTLLTVGPLPNFPISLEDYTGYKLMNW